MAEILTILLSLAFSAFFSGMGVAYISANKMSLEVEKQKNTFTSNLLTIFSDNPEQFIATMRVGYITSLVISVVAIAKFLELQIANYISSGIITLFIQITLSVFIILIVNDFLAKTLFKINPNGNLKFFSVPALLCYIAFYPIVLFCLYLSKGIIKHLFHKKISPENDKNVFILVDADYIAYHAPKMGEEEKNEEEADIELFRNALDFSKVKVRDCIVPRTELEAVEDTSSIDDLKAKFIETGYSKILVYNENTDNIIGYVHSSQMYKNPSDIKSVMNPISFVPETMMASTLLSTFTQKHKSIAIVVDEFGGTSGMVTTEDVLEEIFGEIEDEHDTDDLIVKKIKENEWILSARHEISLLNVKYHFNLPEDDEYDTIAGFILNQHENIPKKNSIIRIGSYEFRILKATETRIELVLMKIIASF
jgi:CBS domain containing-hemolysin-like protein